MSSKNDKLVHNVSTKEWTEEQIQVLRNEASFNTVDSKPANMIATVESVLSQTGATDETKNLIRHQVSSILMGHRPRDVLSKIKSDALKELRADNDIVTVIADKFRRKRNEVGSAIRRSRKEYETQVLERAVDKPKVLFVYINSRLKNKETILVLKGENNEDIIENDAKAEHLSRFFVSVFTDETDFDEAGLPAGTTNEIIENIDFTEEDVRKELLALKEAENNSGTSRAWNAPRGNSPYSLVVFWDWWRS
ncbi:hypothetical protein SprV_0401434600 [Sparganum proliferum]